MAEVFVCVVEGDETTEKNVMDAVDLEAAVDEDIASFDHYFQKVLMNADPLAPSERAILKTYLWWKTHPESSNASEASPEV